MVKSMTGFPRDSDSESDSGASDDEPPKSKSATAVRKQAVGVRARTNGRFKSSSRARGGPCVRETPRGGARASCSVVLPSGLRDVSSVVIVFDPVFGPRLRRVLDDTTCEENEHKHERRDELYAVSVSRTRTSSAVTDVRTVYVDSTCSKCRQCFFVRDPETRKEPTADLGMLLSALCLS